MPSKKTVLEIIRLLEIEYPEAECSLDYEEPYRLLVSVRLAAQCTDERVNKVTPALFERYPTLASLAAAEQPELEEYIHSCGFFRSKARDIILAANMLISEFGGVVPDNMDDLLRVPGVGRKTANLILGDVYAAPGSVVVDTHCIRLANRMGLVDTKIPEKIEVELRKILPPEKSNDFCHRLVLHGRAVCTARAPRCAECCITEYCGKLL
ncbi:MAG: endonuclease III [Oscillospiraceae bacterium]|jgi:endonuclease-3|nr:endonuclease III [Oscillospiraceae bacterium]